MVRELKRSKNGRFYLIPASTQKRGRGTIAMARFWQQEGQGLLASAAWRTMKDSRTC
jgi:hypothetical protein